MKTCKDCSVMKIIERLRFNLGKGDTDLKDALECAITGELHIPINGETIHYASVDYVDQMVGEVERQCDRHDNLLEDKAERDDIIALVKRIETIEEKVGIE